MNGRVGGSGIIPLDANVARTCSRRPEGSARSSGKHPKATGTGTGFVDLIPQASLRWNAGVHNFMIYGMGDIPVGAYQSLRLSNI